MVKNSGFQPGVRKQDKILDLSAGKAYPLLSNIQFYVICYDFWGVNAFSTCVNNQTLISDIKFYQDLIGCLITFIVIIEYNFFIQNYTIMIRGHSNNR